MNTHADWDHVWGNAAVADRPIIAHTNALARLRAPEAAAWLREKSAVEERFGSVRLVEPSITFDDELALHGGDLTLRLIHTPGHTDDHIAVWIPEIGLCLAGDAAEEPIPEVTSSRPDDLVQMRESLQRLTQLRPEIVLPSHGETTDLAVLARNLDYFERLAHRVDEIPLDRLEEPSCPDLDYDQCVSATRPLSDGPREFSEMCHRKAVVATLARRRLDSSPGHGAR